MKQYKITVQENLKRDYIVTAENELDAEESLFYGEYDTIDNEIYGELEIKLIEEIK